MSFIYKCLICEESFEGFAKFIQHMKKYASEKRERFQCPFCFSVLDNSKSFSKHVKKHETRGKYKLLIQFISWIDYSFCGLLQGGNHFLQPQTPLLQSSSFSYWGYFRKWYLTWKSYFTNFSKTCFLICFIFYRKLKKIFIGNQYGKRSFN